MAEPPRVSAIIVAAGASTRMGFDKLWATVEGRPLVAWSVAAVAACAAIDELVLVAAPSALGRARDLLEELGVRGRVVAGGARRRDSVRAGLDASSGEWVVVHDGARPLVTCALIEQGLEAARATGAAIAALPEPNTVKRVEGGQVVQTLDRRVIWAAQTPQVFRRDILVAAHQRTTEDATDDAALVEAIGAPVRVYEGTYANIKVTTPVDLQVAAALLSERRGSQPAAGRSE